MSNGEKMNKGFQPKVVGSNAIPPSPATPPAGAAGAAGAAPGGQPQQGKSLPVVLQELTGRLSTLEANLQNIFGFMECKTNVMLKTMVENKLITNEDFDAKFKVENKKILDQFEMVNDTVLKRTMSEDPAKTGDWVTINFKGTVDGEVFEGGASDRFEFRIGDQHIMDDLQNGIIGKKTGEKFDVDVMFPADYMNKEVAGKKAIFSVEMLSVKKEMGETA